MKDEFTPEIYSNIFTIHFGKTPEIYSNMVSSWRPIFISYNHSNFIYLVKAYRLGLWIFFHSLTKFFIEQKEKEVIFFIPFFLFKNKYSKHGGEKKGEFFTWSQCAGPLFFLGVTIVKLGNYNGSEQKINNNLN